MTQSSGCPWMTRTSTQQTFIIKMWIKAENTQRPSPSGRMFLKKLVLVQICERSSRRPNENMKRLKPSWVIGQIMKTQRCPYGPCKRVFMCARMCIQSQAIGSVLYYVICLYFDFLGGRFVGLCNWFCDRLRVYVFHSVSLQHLAFIGLTLSTPIPLLLL